MPALTPAQKMTKARGNLVMGHPFFGALALRLRLAEDTAIKTAACDGVTLKYNPEWVDSLDSEQITGLVAHEVLHPAMLHHVRRGNRDPAKWNQACDYAINGILTRAGFALPSGTYVNTSYDGMTAEHIYTLLPDPPPSDSPDDPGGDGGVSDSPNSQNSGASASQERSEEAEWKMAVAQAAHVAKQAGKLPDGVERMIDDLMESILPWKHILQRFMTEKSNDDFSWARGNRRFIAQGLYLPSRTSDDAMGEIVIAIDTSGSIGEKELNDFGSEIRGIVNEARPRLVHVIYCDSAIAHVDTFKMDEELKFELHGGGGTDFRPPFEWVRAQQIDPRCFVYLTDGYGPFPEVEPPYPVMWCINNHDVVPPHGEHLVIV